METVTVTNAHGTFTCSAGQLDLAMMKHLPNSVNGLVAKLSEVNPAFDYSDIHYVSEALIMVTAAGEY